MKKTTTTESILYSLFLFAGVFQSLLKGYSLDCQDVDAAINNICEESCPIEVNMTSFLHASCSHFQHLVNEARKDEERETDQSANVTEESRPLSVRFSDELDENDG